MPVGKASLKNPHLFAARAGYSCGLAVLLLLFGSRGLQNAIAEGDTRTISLHHIHTDEDITITFKRDGKYDEAALEKLNWFLRDWRRGEQTRMDPHLIDLVWEVHRESGSKEPVWVVCGYRSPQTNAMLRRRSRGVARFSQHMLGHAMDFYIPGAPLEQLRIIGLRLQRGGVGFYPESGSPFVHMDTGNVRYWPRMTREQLARVFPDGRSVLIPSDGRPLPGYALALADIRKRGSSPSETSIEAARSAGFDVASADGEHRGGNFFAKLFGFHKNNDDEEDSDQAVATAASGTPAPATPEPLRTRAKAAVVAVLDRTENKLAAEKAKLIAAAAKAHVITRAEAAPLSVPLKPERSELRVAALTPNEIIRSRGFWQGVPDGMTARTTTAAADPGAAAQATDNEKTGTLGPTVIGPWTDAPDDHVPAELALAYAEQPERDTSARPVPASTVETPTSHATVTGAFTAETSGSDTTIAMKRVSGRPASVILTIANKTAVAADAAAPGSDPWLRAVLMSPSVQRFLTITALGARDFRTLASLLQKPDTSVMMTFSTNPRPGLDHDHFSGSAVVFVSTVAYPIRSASLQ